MATTITIETSNGHQERQARVFGPLAVFKDVDDRTNRYCWNITHVASGKKLRECTYRADAYAIAQHIADNAKSAGWREANPSMDDRRVMFNELTAAIAAVDPRGVAL